MIIRIACLAMAALLASPALIGVVDIWAWIVIGHTVLIEWDADRACLAVFLTILVGSMVAAAKGLP